MPSSISHRSILLAGVLLSAGCLAGNVQIPLDMDRGFIESLVREQVFTDTGDTLRINDDGTGCQYLELRRPRISASGGRVMLRADAEARAGVPMGKRCLLALDWRGQLEFNQRPVIGDDRNSVTLRTESWRVLTPGGQTDAVATTVSGWLEKFRPPALMQTHISLAQPLNQFREFLGSIVTRDDTARASALLDSVTLDDVSAHDDRVTVMLALTAPPAPVPPRIADPALSEAELAQLESRLEAVDAFATYIIRQLTISPGAEENMDALFDALLELRYELIATLSEPQRRDDDPARVLFIKTWDRLTPILRAIADRQSDYDSAVRYFTFIGSGDMLRALDRLGPAAGIDISDNGLRRLARILIPLDIGDPLLSDDAVDPVLRESFGFGAPLPPPQDTDPTSWLDWFVQPALAASGLDPAMVKKLNNWVPGSQDMDVYLPMVREVLLYAVKEQLRSGALERAYHDTFKHLILAAAWQESCWRQFSVKKKLRVPLQSGSGDIGMMQINSRVWRGFYDQHGLKWDIVYNAHAGADILERYVIKYAIRNGEHKRSGKADNLARSAYAAYNGGPGRYDRYRRKDVSANAKQVDALFYEKYRAVSSGNVLAVKACYGR